jgi:hypothetical protein
MRRFEMRTFALVALAVLVLIPVAAYADYVTVLPGDYTGDRSVGDGITAVGCYTTSCAHGGPNGLELEWTITPSANGWVYEYTFSGLGNLDLGKRISHLLLQVSETFSLSNISGLTINGSSVTPDGVSDWGAGQGNSNPGIPYDSLYSIKIPNVVDGNITFEFTSDRQPIWGNFYLKGGNDSWAYNSGFLTPPSSTMPNFEGYIPTPDTTGGQQVPEPGSLLLLGTGLLGLGVLARRKMRK